MKNLFTAINTAFINLLTQTNLDTFLNIREEYSRFFNNLNTNLYLIEKTFHDRNKLTEKCQQIDHIENIIQKNLTFLIKFIEQKYPDKGQTILSLLIKLQDFFDKLSIKEIMNYPEYFYNGIDQTIYLTLFMFTDLSAVENWFEIWRLNYLAKKLQLPPLMFSGEFTNECKRFTDSLIQNLELLISATDSNSLDYLYYQSSYTILKQLLTKNIALDKIYYSMLHMNSLFLPASELILQYFYYASFYYTEAQKVNAIQLIKPIVLNIYTSKDFNYNSDKQQLVTDVIHALNGFMKNDNLFLSLMNLLFLDNQLKGCSPYLKENTFKVIENFTNTLRTKNYIYKCLHRINDILININQNASVSQQSKNSAIKDINYCLSQLSSYRMALRYLFDFFITVKINLIDSNDITAKMNDALINTQILYQSLNDITTKNKSRKTSELHKYAQTIDSSLKSFKYISLLSACEEKYLPNSNLEKTYSHIIKSYTVIHKHTFSLANTLFDSVLDKTNITLTAVKFLVSFSKLLNTELQSFYEFWVDFLLTWLNKIPANLSLMMKHIEAIAQTDGLNLSEFKKQGLVKACQVILCICCRNVELYLSDLQETVDNFFMLLQVALKATTSLKTALIYTTTLFSESVFCTNSLLVILNQCFDKFEIMSPAYANKIYFDSAFSLFKAKPLSLFAPPAEKLALQELTAVASASRHLSGSLRH